jgi:hypothetical protein
MKPIVKYHRLLSKLAVGESAFLRDLTGHPRQGSGRLDGDYVQTSPVVRVGENGEFETRNTVYQPE